MSSVPVRAATTIGALLVTVAAITACSGSTAVEHHHGASPQGAAQAGSAAHNSDDLAFVTDMMPHHLQAVEMSAMVPSRTTNPELLVVAQHISSDQQAEILTFRGLLAQWGEPPGNHSGHTGAMTMAMPGMVDPGTMDRLRSLRDAPFDELWISSMIGHHQGAITMAQRELTHGQSADARRIAEMIITAQRREIAQMNNLLNVTT